MDRAHQTDVAGEMGDTSSPADKFDRAPWERAAYAVTSWTAFYVRS
jgi:hypothetical protein